MIWGGADVIIIEIKCTVNVLGLNHLKPSPPSQSRENCLLWHWSLVPKSLGPTALQDLQTLDHPKTHVVKQPESVETIQRLRVSAFVLCLVISWQVLCRVCLSLGNELPGGGPGRMGGNQVCFNKDPSLKAAFWWNKPGKDLLICVF